MYGARWGSRERCTPHTTALPGQGEDHYSETRLFVMRAERAMQPIALWTIRSGRKGDNWMTGVESRRKIDPCLVRAAWWQSVWPWPGAGRADCWFHRPETHPWMAMLGA